MAGLSQLGNSLYRGDVSYNIVGRRKAWYLVSAILIILSIATLGVRGLNLGIEFKGGAEFSVPLTVANDESVSQARETVLAAGETPSTVTIIGGDTIRIQTPALSTEASNALSAALADSFAVEEANIKVQLVGPSWGDEVTQNALRALLVFLVLVAIFLSIYFEWQMAIAALAALISTWTVRNILNSRYGRAWRAGRGHEVAAQLAGINTARSKVLAFTISAGIAGLAGALLAMTIGTVSPSAFPLSLSFAVLTGAVLAGITTLGGVILGAFVLVIIPEIADVIAHRLGTSESVTTNLPGLIVSGLLILTVLFVPNGPVEQHRARKAKHEALLGSNHK